jgi:hypothetical protein
VPRLSILIPALGEGCEFEDTLASVLQHRPDDCEVIVAHSQPYDDPYHLAGEVCFVPDPSASRLVELLNVGFEAACSSIVHVLRCGLTVEQGWTEPALECFDDESIATVAPVILAATAPYRIQSAGLGYSRRGQVFAEHAGRTSLKKLRSSHFIGPTLAAGFYRRSGWRLVRWDEAYGDEFADAHYNLTLAELGASTMLASECVVHSHRPMGLSVDEPYGFRTACRAETLFWSHSSQQRTGAAIAGRVALMLGEALLALPSPQCITGLVGRAAGLLSQAHSVRHKLRIAELHNRLADEEVSRAIVSLHYQRERHTGLQWKSKRAA